MTLLEAHLSLPLVHWSTGSKKQLTHFLVPCRLLQRAVVRLWLHLMGICTILEVKCCGRGSVGYLVLLRVITVSIQNANPVLWWVAQTQWNMLLELLNYQQERVVEIIQVKRQDLWGGSPAFCPGVGVQGCACEIPKVPLPGQPRSPCDHGEVPELLGHSSRNQFSNPAPGVVLARCRTWSPAVPVPQGDVHPPSLGSPALAGASSARLEPNICPQGTQGRVQNQLPVFPSSPQRAFYNSDCSFLKNESGLLIKEIHQVYGGFLLNWVCISLGKKKLTVRKWAVISPLVYLLINLKNIHSCFF